MTLKFSTKNSDLLTLKTDCLILFVDKENRLCHNASPMPESLSTLIETALKKKSLKKSNSSVTVLPCIADTIEHLMLVRIDSLTPSLREFETLSAKVAAAAIDLDVGSVSIELQNLMPVSADASWTAQTIAIAFIQNRYRYTQFKTEKKSQPALRTIALLAAEKSLASEYRIGLKKGAAIGHATDLARDLGNMPGNVCTPTYLAERAQQMAKKDPRLTTSVLGETQMKKLGMGSLLSVSAGSEEPAQLIVMEYQGGKKNDAPYVLVGKGITFDTGGISLKPGAAMDEMKFDMCGAASVFGVMQAVLELGLPINVIGIVAAAENMPSGKATKPGDIVTTMSGKTVEILNTDAEGRLVLCDALTYAERFNPKTIIDIATLTGACVIALGKHASGLFSNNDELAQQLLTAGERTGDRAWRMPLWSEYEKQLESPFADLANIGGRDAGSVTAACFLAHFTRKQTWAHLDIAGTAWNSGSKKGATGRPVALLFEYLCQQIT